MALGKAHTRSSPNLSSLHGCPRNSANVCLVEHRSFPTSEGGMSAASFLHSSFFQAVNAVMHCDVRVQKVPQASEHPWGGSGKILEHTVISRSFTDLTLHHDLSPATSLGLKKKIFFFTCYHFCECFSLIFSGQKSF